MAPTTRRATRKSKPSARKSTARNAASNVRVGGRTKEQRHNRNRVEAEKLALVNGATSASKVQPGDSPAQGNWDPAEEKTNLCSICGRAFKEKHQVRSHMFKCVQENGNPTGAFWDDAWSGRLTQAAAVGAPTAPQALSPPATAAASSRSASDESESDDEDLQAQNELEEEVNSDGELQSQTQESGAQGQARQAPQEHTHTNPPNFPPSSSSHDPTIRMETQSNRTLLELLRKWKLWFKQVRTGEPFIDESFLRLVRELETRGVLDAEGLLVVDLRGLDLEYMRVVEEDEGRDGGRGLEVGGFQIARF